MHEEDALDLELHRRVVEHDRGAFEELYLRYAPPAYGVAFRVLGQDAIAQEVVHDAFLALWRTPEAFDPGRGAFRSFFLSLVHHRAVDAVRREERHRRRTERASNLEPLEDEDVADDVVETTYLRSRRREIREALAGLPADQRRVIELAYFDGHTQAAIADMLHVPLGTVKTRTLAAMRKLRRALYRED